MQSAWTVTTGLGNNLDLIVVLALDGVFDSKVSRMLFGQIKFQLLSI